MFSLFAATSATLPGGSFKSAFATGSMAALRDV
jgi:hypothetical protein